MPRKRVFRRPGCPRIYDEELKFASPEERLRILRKRAEEDRRHQEYLDRLAAEREEERERERILKEKRRKRMTKTTEDKRIVIRVPPKDHKRLERAAKELSLTVATYCKLAAFEKLKGDQYDG